MGAHEGLLIDRVLFSVPIIAVGVGTYNKFSEIVVTVRENSES